MLDKNGYNYKSKGGQLRVMEGFLVVKKGLLQNGLYVLQGSAVTSETITIEASHDKTQLPHNKLGHMGLKWLVTFGKHGLLYNKEIKNFELCEDYTLGKAHRLKFDVGIHKTKATLDCIHSYIWGSSMIPPSLSNC